MTAVPSSPEIVEAVRRQRAYLLDTLGRFVDVASLSGQEQAAADFMEARLGDLGLKSERIHLDTDALSGLPLYSPRCCPDGGRYNLLAVHEPRHETGRSVLFNGHLDVVPTGPEALWARPPFQSHVDGDWLFGRGAGDMKAGIVCTLAALKTLQSLGLQPAGRVGFNAVLEEECTGNGALASVSALRRSINAGKLAAFDVVLIPEPGGERLIAAQMGVLWLEIRITGRPAHAAVMTQGASAIDAAIAVIADLKLLEAEWNAPAARHPVYRDHAHPINFNIGQIHGGEWNSSVPCMCTIGVRIGFYPDRSVDSAATEVEKRVRAAIARLDSDLSLTIRGEGFRAPGCEFDLDGDGIQALDRANASVHGTRIKRHAITATTDARHLLRARGTQHSRDRRVGLDREHLARDDDLRSISRRLVRRRTA